MSKKKKQVEEFKWEEDCEFEELLGKTLVLAERRHGGLWSVEEIVFKTADGEKFKLFNLSNCWEPTWLEDICGDLEDLVGKPILLAEKVSNVPGEKSLATRPDQDPSPVGHNPATCTWTFYKLATNAGAVTIRWYGEFSGAYGMEVCFGRCVSEPAPRRK